MKKQILSIRSVALFTLLTLNAQISTAFAQGTAFTYQGGLTDGANPANGSYDLRFALFDANANGSQVGGTLTNAATAVSNGQFVVTLDFGNQFPGPARWLEIGVRTNGGNAFTTLVPRQAISPTPYAITASNATGNAATATIAGSAASFTGPLAGDVTGTQSSTVVSSVGGQSAANVAGGASAANTATSANTGSTIVKRDASGNFN